MAPLMKKRKAVPLSVKVNRLEKAVNRQRPDLQYAQISVSASAGINGYNEWLIDCLPSDVLDNVKGDFYIESIHARANVRNATGFLQARLDILDSKDGGVSSLGATDPQQFLPPKVYKTYASDWMAANDANWKDSIEIKAYPKLLVSRQNGVTVRHQPYVAFRENTNATGGNTKIDVLIAFREK